MMALRFGKRLLIAVPMLALFLAGFLAWLVLNDVLDRQPEWIGLIEDRLLYWAES